jgi:hypothetical protein
MQEKMTRKRAMTVFASLLVILSCSNTPLEQYEPQSDEEAHILAVLVRYQQARQEFNLQGYLSCLHAHGRYHHASRVMVSKKNLSILLPDFWDELRTGQRFFYPMCRENLSGNYFVGFHLSNPRIIITRNTAKVVVTYAKAGWRLKHYISLIKDNQRWWINRLDWETG